jgi:glycosyltransferase involved in cell wall biosynthesis
MQKKIIQGVTSSLSVLLIEDQVHYIEENGYEIKVVCNNDFDKLYEDITMNNIPFEREISIGKDLSCLYRLARYLHREKPDIINFSTPKAGLLGMIAGYLTRVKTRIYVQRGLRLETITGLKKAILYTTERLTCRFSTHVIVISDSLEQELIQKKIVDPNKVVRIGRGSSNGIDMEKFNIANIEEERLASLKSDLGISPSDFIIGYVGRLTRDKGINELVEAFETLENKYEHLKLLLVGDFEAADPVKEENKQKIANNPSIIHHPFTDDVEYYYTLMDLFAFPTFREGFGNVSIEAQAMRVPVVTFNSTGARDTVLPNVTGVITEDNTARGLADGLEHLIDNENIRKRMGEDARAFATENFDRKRMQKQLLDFYNSLGEREGYDVEENDHVLDT